MTSLCLYATQSCTCRAFTADRYRAKSRRRRHHQGQISLFSFTTDATAASAPQLARAQYHSFIHHLSSVASFRLFDGVLSLLPITASFGDPFVDHDETRASAPPALFTWLGQHLSSPLFCQHIGSDGATAHHITLRRQLSVTSAVLHPNQACRRPARRSRRCHQRRTGIIVISRFLLLTYITTSSWQLIVSARACQQPRPSMRQQPAGHAASPRFLLLPTPLHLLGHLAEDVLPSEGAVARLSNHLGDLFSLLLVKARPFRLRLSLTHHTGDNSPRHAANGEIFFPSFTSDYLFGAAQYAFDTSRCFEATSPFLLFFQFPQTPAPREPAKGRG
jgi:hypothetical protein